MNFLVALKPKPKIGRPKAVVKTCANTQSIVHFLCAPKIPLVNKAPNIMTPAPFGNKILVISDRKSQQKEAVTQVPTVVPRVGHGQTVPHVSDGPSVSYQAQHPSPGPPNQVENVLGGHTQSPQLAGLGGDGEKGCNSPARRQEVSLGGLIKQPRYDVILIDSEEVAPKKSKLDCSIKPGWLNGNKFAFKILLTYFRLS